MAKQRRPDDKTSDLSTQAAGFVSEHGQIGEGNPFLKRYLMRSLEVFLYWMPVWVPLILLAQIGTLGLKASRKEEQRLIGHEEELQERFERDTEEMRGLNRQLEALDNEIYLERLRRQRVEEQKLEIEERGLAPLPPVSGTGSPTEPESTRPAVQR